MQRHSLTDILRLDTEGPDVGRDPLHDHTRVGLDHPRQG